MKKGLRAPRMYIVLSLSIYLFYHMFPPVIDEDNGDVDNDEAQTGNISMR